MNVSFKIQRRSRRGGLGAVYVACMMAAAPLFPAEQALAQSSNIKALAEAVGAPSSDARGPAEGAPRFEGTLNVATDREHPHFDPHLTTTNHVIEISNHVTEALFTLGAKGTPEPSLAESYEVSEDGKIYTIKIRSGVKMHNGDVLASSDVVASLNRYLTYGTYGRREVAANVASVDAVDDLTVKITLNERFPFILYQLSAPIGGGPFIYPKELIEEVEGSPITQPIGTGPYRFVSYRKNVSVVLERFEDYVGREEAPSGFAGGRVAYFDRIVEHYVADEAVRVAGLQTGEYQIAVNITPDLYELYKDDPAIRPRVVLATWPCFNFNKQSGPMTDQRVREAFRLAIDVSQIAPALGPDEFVSMDPALVFQGSPWFSEVGDEIYRSQDMARAQALLQESDYDGLPIRILVNPSRPHIYTPAVIAQPMLEEAGFSVELVPVDSATYSEFRSDPNRMDVFSCAYSPRQDPTLMVALGARHPGWWDTEEKTRLITEMQTTDDMEVRYAAWEELQRHFYEYVPLMKIANLAQLHLESADYSGAWYEVAQRYYLNTWSNE
ncbi:ABC transporter substrate-binding protein [Pelagibius sp.]|uniref:ABC transporter substrate-binding protein n=1 Tax=Pelagibius sp. TaxID=1931238 RepID=UPI003BB0B6AA